jgi:hypothetical protein
MQIQIFRAWQTLPVLNVIYKESTSGKLRYAAKQNAKGLEPHYESCMEWIRSDKVDHKWEGDAIPFSDKAFIGRFEDYLLEEMVEFTPYYFTEGLMEFADGITGDQENMVSWLFSENKPEEKKPADKADTQES